MSDPSARRLGAFDVLQFNILSKKNLILLFSSIYSPVVIVKTIGSHKNGEFLIENYFKKRIFSDLLLYNKHNGFLL